MKRSITILAALLLLAVATAARADTLKANLSVGMPLDLMAIARDSFKPVHERRIEADDPYFQEISSGWGEALKQAFHSLPDYSMAEADRLAAE